jgi:hypothetical protein
MFNKPETALKLITTLILFFTRCITIHAKLHNVGDSNNSFSDGFGGGGFGGGGAGGTWLRSAASDSCNNETQKLLAIEDKHTELLSQCALYSGSTSCDIAALGNLTVSFCKREGGKIITGLIELECSFGNADVGGSYFTENDGLFLCVGKSCEKEMLTEIMNQFVVPVYETYTNNNSNATYPTNRCRVSRQAFTEFNGAISSIGGRTLVIRIMATTGIVSFLLAAL